MQKHFVLLLQIFPVAKPQLLGLSILQYKKGIKEVKKRRV